MKTDFEKRNLNENFMQEVELVEKAKEANNALLLKVLNVDDGKNDFKNIKDYLDLNNKTLVNLSQLAKNIDETRMLEIIFVIDLAINLVFRRFDLIESDLNYGFIEVDKSIKDLIQACKDKYERLSYSIKFIKDNDIDNYQISYISKDYNNVFEELKNENLKLKENLEKLELELIEKEKVQEELQREVNELYTKLRESKNQNQENINTIEENIIDVVTESIETDEISENEENDAKKEDSNKETIESENKDTEIVDEKVEESTEVNEENKDIKSDKVDIVIDKFCFDKYESDTLLISEISDLVILPFDKNEAVLKFNSEKYIYNNIDDMILNKYCFRFSDFKNTFWNRYNELVRLYKRTKNYFLNVSETTFIRENVFNKQISPIIIAACDDIEEFEDYKICMYQEKNMNNFKGFKIKSKNFVKTA